MYRDTTTIEQYSIELEPHCPRCAGRMEYHNDGPIYRGPHWYCLTGNCGGLIFPKWESADEIIVETKNKVFKEQIEIVIRKNIPPYIFTVIDYELKVYGDSPKTVESWILEFTDDLYKLLTNTTEEQT